MISREDLIQKVKSSERELFSELWRSLSDDARGTFARLAHGKRLRGADRLHIREIERLGAFSAVPRQELAGVFAALARDESHSDTTPRKASGTLVRVALVSGIIGFVLAAAALILVMVVIRAPRFLAEVKIEDCWKLPEPPYIYPYRVAVLPEKEWAQVPTRRTSHFFDVEARLNGGIHLGNGLVQGVVEVKKTYRDAGETNGLPIKLVPSEVLMRLDSGPFPSKLRLTVSCASLWFRKRKDPPAEREVEVLPKGAFSWDKDRLSEFVVFMVPDHPLVADFVERFGRVFLAPDGGLIREVQTSKRDIPPNVILALGVFFALKNEEAFSYAAPPVARRDYDVIKTPAELLRERRNAPPKKVEGNCKDFVPLLCSILEGLKYRLHDVEHDEERNVPTCYVVRERHVFMLFDTGVSPARLAEAGISPKSCTTLPETVSGHAWMPLETNHIGVPKDAPAVAWPREADKGGALPPDSLPYIVARQPLQKFPNEFVRKWRKSWEQETDYDRKSDAGKWGFEASPKARDGVVKAVLKEIDALCAAQTSPPKPLVGE